MSTAYVDVAHRLHADGLHVFPVDHPDHQSCQGKHPICDGVRGKHPTVSWGTWAIAPTPQLIDMEWGKRGGHANIGIATGPSNLVVFDEDQQGELARWCATNGVHLPVTKTVDTGRGIHHYFRHDHKSNGRIGNVPKIVDGFTLDIRGDGGYVVAEGSKHANGHHYAGTVHPIAKLPDDVAELLLAATNRATTPAVPSNNVSAAEAFLNINGERTENPNTARIPFRGRHNQLIAYAGRLRDKGLDYAEALPVFRQRWLLCEQPTGMIPEAVFHSTPPPDCNYPVTWEEAEAKLSDVYYRYPAGDPSAANAVGDPAGEEPTTWEPIDLTDWLSGEKVSPNPEVGITRSDGLPLLYAGKEHTVFGETECGKSWFALQACAVEIRKGKDVVYIHFEEGDPGSTIERLKLLALTPEQISSHLRFAAPARPVRGDWLGQLIDPAPSLVILDGVNEAISLHGDDVNHIDGASEFRRHIVKPFLAVGAASLSCDHVTKSGAENRGRYSMGSIHKTNAIDGAAFLMENVEPFGRGMRGASAIFVTKDRPGQLRQHGEAAKIAGKTFMGMLAVDATGNTPDFLTVFPPNPDKNGDGDYSGPGTTLAEEIYGVLLDMPDGSVDSRRRLMKAMRDANLIFTDTSARNALDDLLDAGDKVEEFRGRNNSVGYRVIFTPASVSGASSTDGAR